MDYLLEHHGAYALRRAGLADQDARGHYGLGDEFLRMAEVIRARGFSLDEQENQLGMNCLAVPVYLTSPTVPSGVVTALAYRTPPDTLVAAVDDITATLGDLGRPGRS